MKIEKIKPIPKYIIKLIRKKEKTNYFSVAGRTRFYSYLTKNDGELVKVIVACKNKVDSPRWRCKQVVVHGVHSKECFIKDIVFYILGNYYVGWFAEGLQKEPKWYESNDWGFVADRYFNIWCPVLNPEYALKFPEYKYSAIDVYPYTDTLQYLRIYEKHPQAEMLVKFGLPQYAMSVQILRKVAKDKKFRKWLVSKRNELNSAYYYVETVLIAYKTGKPFNKVQEIEKAKKSFYGQDGYRNVKELFKKDKDVTAFIEYLKDKKISLSMYSDYLYACNYLGLDMSLSKNRFPHDFKHWHDVRIDEYKTAKALKDEEERKDFCNKFAKTAEKYLPLERNNNDAFVVVIARSPKELINEGNALHHCVGKMHYDQKFIREESLIFFVRNASEPDIPFVTVEYSLSKKKVLQCYAEHNNKPSENVMNFVNHKWLPFANKQLKRIQSAA